jgi:ABC-type multidrug transport system fused ATPase/permease subunit
MEKKQKAGMGSGGRQQNDPYEFLRRLAIIEAINIWRSSFVIAHRLSTIRDADNVIVINNGEIVEQGTHPQLLEARGFSHHLYPSQFKGLAI